MALHYPETSSPVTQIEPSRLTHTKGYSPLSIL